MACPRKRVLISRSNADAWVAKQIARCVRVRAGVAPDQPDTSPIALRNPSAESVSESKQPIKD